MSSAMFRGFVASPAFDFNAGKRASQIPPFRLVAVCVLVAKREEHFAQR